MIVENKNIEKTCSFYVSDFHLEMILVPYINEKLDNNEEINIVSENNLKDSLEILISKINIKNENKQKIINLEWNKQDNIKIKDNTNMIIIGTKEYINMVNKKVEEANLNDIKLVNCYEFDEVKDEIANIVNIHNNSLNTIGFNKLK